jgi:hypothetical protein
MNKRTLFATGAWALGLLAGLFAWLSPDSVFFPGPILALLLVAAALVVLTVGAIASAWPKGAARSSLTDTLGAMAPVFGAALALILAARGLLPHPVLPLGFILLVGLGAGRWARGRSATPMTWKGDLLAGLLLVAALFVVVPALLLGAGGQILWAVATPSFGPTVARLNVTNVLAPQRFAPHAGITATAAGSAMQAIANTGTARRESLLIDVPGSSPRPWIPDSGPFNGWSGDSLMRHALRGLTREERSWLQQLATHPGLPLIDTVAFAVALDPWAALKTPLPEGLNAFALPIAQVMPVRNAARMQLYRAALAAADHKPAVADSLTRTAISFGLRLRDDSDLLIQSLIGSAIAREGGLTLATLWRAGGRAAEADALVASLRYPGPAPTDTKESSSPRTLRALLIREAQAPANGRAIRFEHLVVLGMSSCTDLRELLYGPTPDVAAAFAASAPLFQRTPKEQEVFARMTFGIAPIAEAGVVAPLLRPAAAAFGRRPVGACAQLVSATSVQ